MTCVIEACDRRVYNRSLGLCEAHNRRRLRGRLHIGKPIGEAPKGPPPGEPSYSRTHYRLATENGPASAHVCTVDTYGVECDAQGEEWALIRVRRVDDDGALWSPDLADYAPLCRCHHRRLDVALRALLALDPRQRGIVLHPSNNALRRTLEGEPIARVIAEALR